MRGFRASRASQNFKSAHFGKMEQKFQQKQSAHGQTQHQQQQQKAPKLPAWLRMPEQPQAKKETHLRLVKNEPVVAKAKPVKRVAKVTAKATGVTKAKAAPKKAKAVVKKRKAA